MSHNTFTFVAMQNLDNQVWISTKLKLYNSCILPIFLYGSECWERCTQDCCSWSMMSVKAVRNQMVTPLTWDGQTSKHTFW